jgi:hypothetical protein
MYFMKVRSQIVGSIPIGSDGQGNHEAQCRSPLRWAMRQVSGDPKANLVIAVCAGLQGVMEVPAHSLQTTILLRQLGLN